MIIDDRASTDTASMYAVLLIVDCSPDSMASLLHIGLCATTALALANVRLDKGEEPVEVYDILTDLATSNPTSKSEKTRSKASNWMYRRFESLQDQGVIGCITRRDGHKNTDRKYVFLTEKGKEHLRSLDARFDLAYVQYGGKIDCFGIVKRQD